MASVRAVLLRWERLREQAQQTLALVASAGVPVGAMLSNCPVEASDKNHVVKTVSES